MESKLQIQVQIGDTRRVFLINPPRTYLDLRTAILHEIPKTKYMEFGLQYENDEGEYVVLNDDEICLRIAISSSKRIQGTDISRMKLRVFEGSSPSIKPKDVKNTNQLCSRTSSSISSNPVAARLSLCYQGYSSDENDTDNEYDRITNTCNTNRDTNKSGDEQTPTERYIAKSEEKIEEKRSVIQSLREKLEQTESKLERVKSNPRDGNVCRNCHLRLGHTSRSCDYGKCTSVFKCGMEKFHPGEHNVKDLRNQLKKHERELEKLVEELKCKKNAVDAAKDKVQLRIESDLFQSNKATYTVNGVKNWSLLRKHVYLVQEYCKKNLDGRIPAKQDIEMILDKALCESDCPSLTNKYHRSKQSGSRKRGNPAKESLERHGIDFPASKYCADDVHIHDEVPSKILYTAPSNEGEEAEQLAMVLRESVRHNDKSKETHTIPKQGPAFPFPYTPRFPVFPSAVDYNPMTMPMPIGHDQINLPTIAMYNPMYNSASIESSAPIAYSPCLGSSSAFPANVGPYQYQTEHSVLPVNSGEAIVVGKQQHQDTEETSDETSRHEAASLLLNMATH